MSSLKLLFELQEQLVRLFDRLCDLLLFSGFFCVLGRRKVEGFFDLNGWHNDLTTWAIHLDAVASGNFPVRAWDGRLFWGPSDHDLLLLRR